MDRNYTSDLFERQFEHPYFDVRSLLTFHRSWSTLQGEEVAWDPAWKLMADRDAGSIWAEMDLLRTPRPNGSRALRRAVGAVEEWLVAEGIPARSHQFTLRPLSMEILGGWFMLGGLLLVLAGATRQGGHALLVALSLIAIPLLETRFLQPTITALVRHRARNLVASFPAPAPRREVILCAHIDSKTELLDHERRARLLRLGPAAMALAVTGALLLAGASLLRSEVAKEMVFYLALFFGIVPAAGCALGMGANLAAGRLRRRQSSGAVDNGAAVAVLLDTAWRLQRGTIPLEHTSVTLLFTVGEEAQMQGALAYVRDRDNWPLPTSVVNLEILGQDGGYLLWAEDGTAMLSLEADAELNAALVRAVEAKTGERPTTAPQINSDAFAFLRQGIPAATLGSYDQQLGERELHGPLDSPERVCPARLIQATNILARFLVDLDQTLAEKVPGRACRA
jgi:hypothetical protein